MSEDLKTLKDMDFAVFEPRKGNSKKAKKFTMKSLYREEDLRAEAIKWLKSLTPFGGAFGHKYVIYWIMHFFNIGEEELK